MDWKERLWGAAAALTVTVVGGVVVYYATKEPVEKPAERLYYSVRSSSHFSGDKQRISFSSVELRNVGDLPASNVVAMIKVPAGTVQDIEIDAALAPGIEQEIEGGQVVLKFTRLLPSEAVTVNLLSTWPGAPSVVMRSDNSIGRAASPVPVSVAKDKSRANRVAAVLVPISAAIFTLVGVWWTLRFRKVLDHSRAVFPNRNNAAFVLLHGGLVEEASRILASSLKEGSYDAHILSNMAVCEQLVGEDGKAKGYVNAARFVGKTKHTDAVVAFNEAIISILDGDVSRFKERLAHAYSQSPLEIKRYIENSVHFEEFKRDSAVAKAIAEIESSAMKKS